MRGASLIGGTYRRIIKPVLFRFDPETVHNATLGLGSALGRIIIIRGLTHHLLAYANDRLAVTVAGIPFANPVGLAAGFDKNAKLVGILPSVGFGFAEIGSITWGAYAGNPRPRLTRLPKSRSVVVNFGLSGEGCDPIAKRLEESNSTMPIGTSIAPTNSPTTATLAAAVDDVAKSYERLSEIGAYTTLNLSCPNTHHDQPFMQPDWLEALLKTVTTIRTTKPLFLKLSPDHSLKQINELLTVADRYEVAGVIAANATKPRTNPRLVDDDIPTTGGLTGKPTELLANKLISHIYRTYGNRFAIIGVGGVFSAADAYEKIQLGASLVQLITGMIYQGPQLIGEINRGLVELLDRDGYGSISEAVGSKPRSHHLL